MGVAMVGGRRATDVPVEWVERIDAAINSDSVRIVYQPIVNLWADAVVGYEALARFTEGRPDEYFGWALQSGQHHDLEVKCARMAIEQYFSHESASYGRYLSVNVCHDCLMMGKGSEAFTNAPMRRIQMEITEHQPIADYRTLRDRLRPFRERGAGLAVDDVGAGYAALRHVLMLDPNTIKLDRSMITSIHEVSATTQRALLIGMTNFASRAHIDLVAEGIETSEEMTALRTLGVNYGQGYYLGKPGDLPERDDDLDGGSL